MPPLPLTRLRSSEICWPALGTEPATCTELTFETAFVAAATIWSGDFEATPLEDPPLLLLPHAAMASRASMARIAETRRGRM